MKTWSSLVSNYRTLEINPSIVVLLVALMEKIQIKINSTKQTRHSRRVDWSGGWWQKRLIVLLLLSISYSATLEMLIVLNGQLYCSWFHNLLPSSTSFSLHNQTCFCDRKKQSYLSTSSFFLILQSFVFRLKSRVSIACNECLWIFAKTNLSRPKREKSLSVYINSSILRYIEGDSRW